MEELIRTFHPDEMAVEELFFTKNITTGIAVAHGRGVILLSAERLGVPVFEYTPMQVKQAVAGYGGADQAAGHADDPAPVEHEAGSPARRRRRCPGPWPSATAVPPPAS